jgi:UTP--glucose-1-phosphate uridylyltransferase
MGRYVLMPRILQILEDTPPGRNGEIQLTDGLKRLAKRNPIYAYEFKGERYDAGTPLGWLETNVALALKNPDIGPKFKEYLNSLLQPPVKSSKTLTPPLRKVRSRR